MSSAKTNCADVVSALWNRLSTELLSLGEYVAALEVQTTMVLKTRCAKKNWQKVQVKSPRTEVLDRSGKPR